MSTFGDVRQIIQNKDWTRAEDVNLYTLEDISYADVMEYILTSIKQGVLLESVVNLPQNSVWFASRYGIRQEYQSEIQIVGLPQDIFANGSPYLMWHDSSSYPQWRMGQSMLARADIIIVRDQEVGKDPLGTLRDVLVRDLSRMASFKGAPLALKGTRFEGLLHGAISPRDIVYLTYAFTSANLDNIMLYTAGTMAPHDYLRAMEPRVRKVFVRSVNALPFIINGWPL